MAYEDGRSSGDERRRRRDALRALAEGAAPRRESDWAVKGQTPFGAALHQTPRRPRWLIPVISGVILVASVSLIVAHFWPSAPARHTAATMALDPETIGIACLVGAAWSPDGSKLAVLGSQRGCNATGGNDGVIFPDVVVMVDAATGASMSQILPDSDVQKALKLVGRSTLQPIFYSGVTWSPDGKRLALPFAVYYSSAQSGTGGVDTLIGLCIAASDGSNSHTYLVPLADTSRFTGEWNLKTGKPLMWASVPSNQVIAMGQMTLKPAALRYTWGADGVLMGTDLLNATSAPAPAPLGPVGNPDGGVSFTAWQPLQVAQNSGDPANPVSPAPFEVYSSYLVWSPDGAYLLSALVGPWRIQPSKQPIPGPDQLKASFTARLPLLPVRDAALDAAMNMLTSKQSITSNGGFAWSPDGRMLSAFKLASNDTTILTVLDCASAKILATITLHGVSRSSASNGNGGMLWSPDGKRLLVESGSELFIVGPAALPKG